MQIDINIQKTLTPDEAELFAIIKQVITQYTPATKAFAVGGWVRDRLLKKQSSDIDIMLSNISGEDFANLITRHMHIKDANVIKANPEASKHITTAKAYIPLSSGTVQEVDFAQARAEVYRGTSRIPEITSATPEEDAHRRDLTINSVFYDIAQDQVVDYTGMGIKDLITNTMRTPADPVQTFMDDPLRIFRVIRFSARFNGKIDPSTYEAMKNPMLRDEIKKKVSKERIGQEITKMFKDPNAAVAIQLLKDTGLLEDIISESLTGTPYQGKIDRFDMNQNNPNHQLTLWGHTMEVVKSVLDQYKDADPERRIVMVLSALMHDLGKLYQQIWGESKSHPGARSYHGHEIESAKMVESILKYLKIEPYIQEVSRLTEHHMKLHTLLRDDGGARTLRRFVRKMGEQSLHWLDVFNLSVADAYAKDVIRDPNTVQEYQMLKEKLQQALAQVSSTPEKSLTKPVLDGNEIMRLLNIKAGPWMSEMTEFLKELRDENPVITKEEAAKLLLEKYKDFKPTLPVKKKAEAETKSNSMICCPQHLFDAKEEEINSLFKEGKHYEVFSTIKNLKEEYEDEKITNLIAFNTFRLLCMDQKYKDIEMLQYILDKAQKNFFDAPLCASALGIMLLLKGKTEDQVLREIAGRVRKMSPKSLNIVLNMLPEQIDRPSLKKEIQNEN
jgi:tRNA nucleotidyltransferase (CCA-adding enzyme)